MNNNQFINELWAERVKWFTDHFIVKSHRDRWLDLLTRRPRKLHSKSHTFHNHLDIPKCQIIHEVNILSSNDQGFFFDFYDDPVLVDFKSIQPLTQGKDCLFFFSKMNIAFFYFHEGEIYYCQEK